MGSSISRGTGEWCLGHAFHTESDIEAAWGAEGGAPVERFNVAGVAAASDSLGRCLAERNQGEGVGAITPAIYGESVVPCMSTARPLFGGLESPHACAVPPAWVLVARKMPEM